ncbi:MAG: hypothetical protein ACREL7_03010 [Longimicrobiales bacterium]
MRVRIAGIAYVSVGVIGCGEAPIAPEAGIEMAAAAVPSVQFAVPAESPGPPFYSISANGGFVPHTDDWAAIPFQRELLCVPPGQDLLVIVGPAAWSCPLTVEGHEHWQHGPGIDLAPRQTQLRGLGAVPIVFAEWAELQGAMVSGLTLFELLALPSALIGHADFYKETAILGISGPHGPGKGSYKINARGTLTDSRSFSLHVNEVLGELRIVRIDFSQ